MSRDIITKPCLVGDMDEDWYHLDPVPESEGGSLSVSGAKILLEAGGPAKYKWARDHGRLPTKSQRLGTVAHGLALGTGQEVAVLEFENRRTNKYREAEEEAIAAGQFPVLRKDYDEARAIADALLLHPVAGGLLDGADPEVSMFWVDEEFGIWQRGRMDALSSEFETPVIVDVKTSKDAGPDAFARAIHEYGYFRQDPHYREGLASHLGCEWRDVDFVFAVVESDPPHLVAIYRVSDGTDGPDDVGLGREHMRIAREKYADCTDAGVWPGYDEDIKSLQLRRYDRQQTEREINEWHE